MKSFAIAFLAFASCSAARAAGNLPVPVPTAPSPAALVDEVGKEVVDLTWHAESIVLNPAYYTDDLDPPAYPCIGDGHSGARFQVIYAYPSDRPNLIAANKARIRLLVRSAAAKFNANGGQHLRFVCDDSQKLDVQVAQSPALGSATGYGALSTVVNALVADGYNRTDRKYVVFTDYTVGSACYGTLHDDDRPTADNLNNKGPSFAMLSNGMEAYGGCWIGQSTLHEITHTLGSVQLSAPHSDGTYHQNQANDVMGGNNLYDCVKTTLDCGHDDYYSAAPQPSGSYLATHWNMANSDWVQK
jgi:hypothetical protein